MADEHKDPSPRTPTATDTTRDSLVSAWTALLVADYRARHSAPVTRLQETPASQELTADSNAMSIAAEGFTPEDEIDLLFAVGSNRDRSRECLSTTVLDEIARRQRPLGDAAYAHLVRCSGCYMRCRRIQQRLGIKPAEDSNS